MALSPTANQGARPRAAYSNAQHAAMGRRAGEPESGGDIGGPKAFLAGKGIPTSGGIAKPGAPYQTDHHNDQGSKRLYLGKAFENAQRVKWVRTQGSSGRAKADVLAGHETDTIKKAAQTRLASKHDATDGRANGDEFSGQPFRRSSGAFGPQRADRVGQDYLEHQNVHGARPGRRMEPGGMAPKHLRSGA